MYSIQVRCRHLVLFLALCTPVGRLVTGRRRSRGSGGGDDEYGAYSWDGGSGGWDDYNNGNWGGGNGDG